MNPNPKPDARGPSTSAVHGPDHERSGAMSSPIVHSATFATAGVDELLREQARGAAGQFYQRVGHPTIHAAERRLAALEGAEAGLLFASGMAAISSVFVGALEPGAHVVALEQCYGGTIEALNLGAERFGWSRTYVDATRPGTWDAAFRKETRLLHVESPTNPTLCIVDLAAAAALAHRHGALLTVDNTFASPLGQHPLELGADLVIYSATKSIGGHSDLLAGVVLGSAKAVEPAWHVRAVLGNSSDPTTAWLIERSLKTLPMRLAAGNANALELALRLERHPAVARVHYPGLPGHPGHDLAARQMHHGFGPVVSIELRDAEQARPLMGALELFRHGPSLGGVESLVTIPALTSHRAMSPADRDACGVTAGLVRFSVGIEDVDDLWKDLDQGLRRPVTASR